MAMMRSRVTSTCDSERPERGEPDPRESQLKIANVVLPKREIVGKVAGTRQVVAMHGTQSGRKRSLHCEKLRSQFVDLESEAVEYFGRQGAVRR
jgi:hypothetical protein